MSYSSFGAEALHPTTNCPSGTMFIQDAGCIPVFQCPPGMTLDSKGICTGQVVLPGIEPFTPTKKPSSSSSSSAPIPSSVAISRASLLSNPLVIAAMVGVAVIAVGAAVFAPSTTRS